MYGAIIGDIVGSKFEFDRGSKTREFELFTSVDTFTDDTVMTCAVAEAIMDAGRNSSEGKMKAYIVDAMKRWGKMYPDAGYGGRFREWLRSSAPKPYGSYGNGSGMRVSSVGWFYESLDKTLEVARWSAEVTHNHPEGVKGAEAVAGAIYMARKGASFGEIKAFWESPRIGYDLSRTLDEIRPTYHHVESCQETMPEAFTCFLESSANLLGEAGFERTIRNVAYIGGDVDTLGAIAGAVAEAYFGVPSDMAAKARTYLDSEIKDVVMRFYREIGISLAVEAS